MLSAMTRWFLLLSFCVPAFAIGEVQTWERFMNEAAELRQARRFADAHQRYAQATAAAADGLGNLYSSVTTIAIGGLFRDEGRTADAERVWRAELVRLESQPAETLGAVLLHLGELYTSQRRYSQAESMLVRCAAVMKDASVLSSLGNLYLLQSRLDEAAESLERAMAVLQANGDQTLDTAVVSFTLAKVYSRMHRSDEADALFERSMSLAAASCRADHRVLAVAVEAFAKHLQGTGRKQRAKELRTAARSLGKEINPADHLIEINALRAEAVSRSRGSDRPSSQATCMAVPFPNE
jgi:tetratricopeptide (TPR) repeat protein